MPVLAKTPGGLQPQKWVLSEYDKRGVVSGYMFNNQDGNRARARAIEDKFHERLQAIQSTRWDLIPESTDVTEEYGTSRSLRRGSTSVTANKGAHPQVIEFNGIIQFIIRQSKVEEDHVGTKDIPLVSTCNRAR